MRALSIDEAGLVRAAQVGDRQALDELIAAYLPIVYNVVGRALSGHPDVDDVVQETMLRALRELGSLRSPESFRPWLMAIAVRQVGTHRHRRQLAARRTAAVEEAAGVPDVEADFEDLTILRLGLSGQRRQAVLASRWLDADDRALLSLWWLETAGQLTRPELAGALGLSVAHAGVRVQRMLDQLELCRSIVAAFAARQRCAELDAVVSDWDGRPSSLWRKRIGRHVRACSACTRAGEGMVPTARLLVGVALVPVPMALSVALMAKAAGSASVVAITSTVSLSSAATSAVDGADVKTGLIGQIGNAIGAHPVASAIVGGAVAAGTAVIVALPTPPRSPVVSTAPPSAGAVTSRPPVTPAPSAAPTSSKPSAGVPRTVALGPVSLESANQRGQFVTYTGDLGVLARVSAASDAPARQRATFDVVPGLAESRCVSFRSQDGRYLRHASWRIHLAAPNGTVLFRQDATFCPRSGSTAETVTFESFNYPGRYLRHVGDALWVDPSDRSAAFRADSTFILRIPLAQG